MSGRVPPVRLLGAAIAVALATAAQAQERPDSAGARDTEAARARVVEQAVLLTVGGPAALLAPLVDAPTAAPSAAEPYRDRIIDPAALPPLPPEDGATDDTDGLPRSIRVELLAGRSERGDDADDEAGVRVATFHETAAHGSLSFDATVFRSDRTRDGDAWGGTATLWQRGLALDGGWRVDNGVGVLNTPGVPLLREQVRFFLPSVSYAGLATAWSRRDAGLDVQAGVGRAGLYGGSRVVGFDVADGHVGALGVQWPIAPAWTGAVSALVTDGRLVPDADNTLDPLVEATLQPGRTRAAHAAAAWSSAASTVQLNLLGSDGDGLAPALGAWVDAATRRGRYRHSAGAFRLEPDLAWGALPISNNVAGGYYRLTYQYARWNWTVGADRLASVEGDGLDGWYATGYARYQATAGLGYGGSLALRRTPDTAHAVQLFVDRRSAWGLSRAQLDQARAGDGDNWQLSLDHDLPLQAGRRLALSASYGSLARDAGDDVRTASLGLYGSVDLTERLGLDGSLRWTEADGDGARRGADVNLGLNWRLARRWLLTAAYFENRGSERSPFVIDPIANDQPFVRLPRDRSLLLSLQFQRDAGRAQAVIGGAPGAASGRIAGSVFLDDNDDGMRSASEQPAANLTVVLDGRFSVRTDSLGNFEFPRVAVGTHTLTVLPDNLPLPWSLDGVGAERTLEVRVRDTARADVGARRPR